MLTPHYGRLPRAPAAGDADRAQRAVTALRNSECALQVRDGARISSIASCFGTEPIHKVLTPSMPGACPQHAATLETPCCQTDRRVTLHKPRTWGSPMPEAAPRAHSTQVVSPSKCHRLCLLAKQCLASATLEDRKSLLEHFSRFRYGPRL